MERTRRYHAGVFGGWALGVSLFFALFPAQAQEPREVRLAGVFAEGLQAFDAADYARAIPLLLQVFKADPAFYGPDRGSAAYWLGQTYFITDQREVAAEAWAQGWAALADKGRLDWRLADALVWRVFEQQDTSRYATATAAYLTLLAHLDEVPPAAHTLRTRHLAPLVLILPDDVRKDVGLAGAEAAAGAGLSAGAGLPLAAWWRRADPLPATPENERLVEHLERVVYAHRHFADARMTSGFDARGTVYIRLGAPSHETPVRMNQYAPSRATVDDPSAPFYPEGMFWVYRHVDETAHFLFVRNGRDPVRLGQPVDLVPKALRGRQGNLELLRVMEGIYRTLALHHPAGHYGSVYEQIANYRGLLDDVALARSLPSARETYQVAPPRPAASTHSLLFRARAQDRRAVRQRDEQVPASYSNLFDAVDDLPVALRWARFLDDDGTTRTELYWGLHARELHPSRRVRRRLAKAGHDPSSTYLLTLAVVRQTAAYRSHPLARKSYRLDVPSDDPASVLPVQSFVARGDTGRYALALQWDAYWAYGTAPDGGEPATITPGPRVKVGAYRVDPLQALSNNPGRLEMSDLKPLRLSDNAEGIDEAPPFPNAVITRATPLALYFEVYHLAFGADDRTHYTVAYEVARSEKKGGLLRVLGGRAENRTEVHTAYTGGSRTARETVALDFSDWAGEGQLDVRVRVTDDTTGQTVERTLSFDVREE